MLAAAVADLHVLETSGTGISDSDRRYVDVMCAFGWLSMSDGARSIHVCVCILATVRQRKQQLLVS